VDREIGGARRPRALVTGGAGFLGSHLCERLLAEGYSVVCVDNLSTGDLENVAHLAEEPAFEHVEHDVAVPFGIQGALDEVYHFASPASPVDFERIPIEILRAGALGTHNSLEHPQHEDYRGNVSTTGIRSVYDEAKRYAEAVTMAYHRHHGLDTRIVRIFNTYGPRTRPDDGRMIPNFISQALAGRPLTVYGDGSQIRSVQYVDDLVEGVLRLMRSSESRPVNIGNPVEYTVREVAEMVIGLSGSRSEIVHEPLPADDPRRRCPDISRARGVLGWEPRTPAIEGLEKTLLWFAGRSGSALRRESGSLQ
jgi:dTDP-glucose 4,6-dehydratase